MGTEEGGRPRMRHDNMIWIPSEVRFFIGLPNQAGTGRESACPR
jgi:hypothetical protein